MSTNITVKTIASACASNNASGLKPVLYVTTEPEVDAIPAATAELVSGDITMTAADAGPPEVLEGTFKRWDLSKVASKLIFDCVQVGDSDSGAHQTTVTVYIPKMTAARVDAMYGGCDFIILVTDMNGALRIVGAKENGATINRQQTINDGANGVTVIFTWLSAHSPYFYTGDIVT